MRKSWIEKTPILLIFLLFVGCYGCELPGGEPPQVTIGWPKAPQIIALETNWSFDHRWDAFENYLSYGNDLVHLQYIGESTFYQLIKRDLNNGNIIWESPINATTVKSSFFDGTNIYTLGIKTSERSHNHFIRTSIFGDFSGYVYYYTKGYEETYTSKTLEGLFPESFLRENYFLEDTKLYYPISYPSLRSIDPEIPSGGGMYMIDFSQVKPTSNPEEFTVEVQKVYGRTNPETRYTHPVIHKTEDGRTLLLFAEVFQKVARLPPLKDNVIDLDYTALTNFIHCVDADTGELLWKISEPYAFAAANITVLDNRVLISTWARSTMVNLHDGNILWQTQPYEGGSYSWSQAIEGNMAYSSKDIGDADDGLEALNLDTGKVVWKQYQYSNGGYGVFYNKGILYVIHQVGIRLYRASDGKYLAFDDRYVWAPTGFYGNKSFVWNGNLIVYGAEQTVSFKMNYELDLFGNLVKVSN